MVLMYFIFPAAANVVIVSTLNFVALFLSFFIHHTSLKKDSSQELFALSCLFSSLLSFFFLRAFLMNPEKSWMFLSSSKFLVAEGFLSFLVQGRKNLCKIALFSTFAFLFVLSILKFDLLLYLETLSLALFVVVLLIKRLPSTFLTVSVFLYSISSLFFFFLKDVYPYHITSGNLFLVWHFVKTYVDIPKKEAEKLSEEMNVPPEEISIAFKNIQDFLVKIPRIMSEIIRENDQKNVREIFNRYFPEDSPSYLLRLKGIFSEFVEEYILFLEERRKFQEVHLVLTKNLAHNLKNPVNAIYVSSQLLKLRYPETSSIAGNIEKICQEMNREIDRILRMSIGEMRTVKKIDLEEALNPSLEMAKLKGLEVELILDFEELELDRDAFLALVTNLFSNAVKYTPSGRVTLRVERRNDRILLIVSDTGPGLKSSNGFGLFTVRKLVNYLNGSMEISEDGGTTFRIVLPIRRDSDDSTGRRG
ncbi:sensor histidine kinase KdpD [Thermotoga sp. SG1]|uniref:sensor histidine kinase n=1 Tax=Thermotoga sp. SG1 TaxID=126739 RepID=UPI000C794FBF|nr:HAMP domain-containing sensor histidine kinase [Thermotoga sp. SG1]PLV57708.1 ATPase [Thermotoga sp. SG1]